MSPNVTTRSRTILHVLHEMSAGTARTCTAALTSGLVRQPDAMAMSSRARIDWKRRGSPPRHEGAERNNNGLQPNEQCSAAGAARNRAAAPSTDQHRGAAATCQTGPGAPVRLQDLVDRSGTPGLAVLARFGVRPRGSWQRRQNALLVGEPLAGGGRPRPLMVPIGPDQLMARERHHGPCDRSRRRRSFREACPSLPEAPWS